MGTIWLGIESSCDDTSVCVAEVTDSTFQVRSLVIQNQNEIHAAWGGVVPDLAAREHLSAIDTCFERALKEAKVSITDIECVAATAGPGLLGSLLVGYGFAQGLSLARNLKSVAVDHIEGHLYSGSISHAVEYPAIALVVSGGHTALFRVEDELTFALLGETRDDAAGEALDKAAKLLGLPFPGGPHIERWAKKGNRAAVALPIGLRDQPGYEFSFSGLKTALSQHLERSPVRNDRKRADLCASYQGAVVDALVRRCRQAVLQFRPSSLIAAGGVAANQLLRSELQALADEQRIALIVPELRYCTDNAAMIALRGWQLHWRGRGRSLLEQSAYPTGRSAVGRGF